MLNYFQKGKGSFVTCEDSLSSSVFDMLKYLPTEMFWRILKQSLYYDKLPRLCGELVRISFWEKWSAAKTNNSNFVEPDIFIEFEDFDIIIEAKRQNESQQSAVQHKGQMQAYKNEYGDNGKKMYYIQLGGLHNLNDEGSYKEHPDVVICKTDWSRLLNQVVSEKNMCANLNLSSVNSYVRVLNDLIVYFEFHGYFKKYWLQDLHWGSRIDYNINALENLFGYAAK